MKWLSLAILLVAIVQRSICQPSASCGTRLDEIQLKLTELLDKFNVLLKNQVDMNQRLKELNTGLESNSPRSVTIPTGCVKIRSFFADKYLAVSSNYDSKRRQLAVRSNPEEWTLVRQDGDIYYRITRRQGQEDLYAAMGSDLYYDSQRRRIFTWIAGFGDDQGKWEIEEAAGFPGMVHIRSTYYGEYLFAADFGNFVFTWIPKDAPGKDSKYVWQIEHCPEV